MSLACWLSAVSLSVAQTCPAATAPPVHPAQSTLPQTVTLSQLVERYCEPLGVPAALGLAVIAVESRGEPYAINVSVGKGYSIYPKSYNEAAAILRELEPVTSEFGVGLMQIHWRYHKNRYPISPEDLLNPVINVRIGCEVLGEAWRSAGTMSERIGRYNATSNVKRLRYAARVLQALENFSRENLSG